MNVRAGSATDGRANSPRLSPAIPDSDLSSLFSCEGRWPPLKEPNPSSPFRRQSKQLVALGVGPRLVLQIHYLTGFVLGIHQQSVTKELPLLWAALMYSPTKFSVFHYEEGSSRGARLSNCRLDSNSIRQDHLGHDTGTTCGSTKVQSAPRISSLCWA